MYPEDRVLIAYMPEPKDFDRLVNEHWYRIPQQRAPKGLYSEYYSFYFGNKFGRRKWSICFYARQLGHELLRRRDIIPDEPEHPRAEELYYRVALGPLIELKEPIVSLRLRRISFLHTTWDRFRDAREISDLFVQGGDYVDRVFNTLKEQGIAAKQDYRIKEGEEFYRAPIVVPCSDGLFVLEQEILTVFGDDLEALIEFVQTEISKRGGAIA